MMLLNTISLLLIKSMSIAWMLQILLPIVFAILVYEIVQNRRVRRKVRHEVEAMQATHDMMDNALKMVVNNVIIYDPQTETIRQLNGQMLPSETISVEEFKNYEGVLGHMHAPDNDHNDPGNIWPKLEKLIGNFMGTGECDRGNVTDVPCYAQCDEKWANSPYEC